MRKSRRFVLTLAVLGCLLAQPSTGKAGAPGANSRFAGLWDSWLRQRTMTGDWGGLRASLNQAGIVPRATYTTNLLGNASGGLRRRFRYAGGLEFGVEFDLQRLLGLKGLVFAVTGDYRSGRDLSADIGNVFTAAHIFGLDAFLDSGSLRLYRLSLEQFLLDDRLHLLAGRIGMGDDFMTSDLYGTFVQTAFNSNPISTTNNLALFSAAPVATWGFRAKLEATPDWYLMGGVYYSDPLIGLASSHGVDFSIRRDNTGALTIFQVGRRRNQGERARGLPGNFFIGAYYDSNRFPDLAEPDRARHGNYGLYFHVDQMVFRERPEGGKQGLTVFLAATFAPLTGINTFPYFAMGGLVYWGLIPRRDHDTTSFGIAYGQFGRRLGRTYEMVAELTHNFQVAPWLGLQPDFQYVVRPGGTGNLPDSFVVGLELTVEF